MDMSGEQRIPAPRDAVWRALNDPDVLRASIPGCKELAKTSDTHMTATVVLKVGPVSARFQGAVTLTDLDPPNGYRIVGEGQGGVAGFAKGEARVTLEEDGPSATLLRYTVDAQVGGKLAQLGARLIDATARQMSAAFFTRFAQEIMARQEGAAAQPQPETQPEAAAAATAATPSAAPAAPAASPAPLRPAHASAAPASALPAGWAAAAIALAFAAGGLVFYLLGSARGGAAGAPVSADLAGAALLMVTAAVGYLFGRLNAPGPRLDPATLDALLTLADRRR